MNAQSKVLLEAAKTVMRGWCQRTAARNVDGVQVELDDPDATRFCATGAIQLCLPEYELSTYERVQRVIRELSLRTTASIVHFNDEVADCPEQVAQLLMEAAGL